MSPDDQPPERPHLLLVGDASLDALRRALENAGHTVEHATAADALDTMSQRTSAAVLSGRRAEILYLCRRIKERFPAPFLPVLAMVAAPARLPQEPTAPDAWLLPTAAPREVVMRVAELLRVRKADAEMVRLNAVLAELAAENGLLYERARREADAAATLLRELQHRVRNNLAAIQALLVLERHRSPPRPLHEALDVAIGRLRSMSALQDCLAARATDVDVRTLFRAVGRGMAEVFPGSPIDLVVEGDAQVNARAASSLAIVFNELLNNARMHGGASLARLLIEKTPAGLSLTLTDSGSGIPERARDGSGWMIARTVVRNELGGQIEMIPGRPGGTVRLTIPGEAVKPPDGSAGSAALRMEAGSPRAAN